MSTPTSELIGSLRNIATMFNGDRRWNPSAVIIEAADRVAELERENRALIAKIKELQEEMLRAEEDRLSDAIIAAERSSRDA